MSISTDSPCLLRAWNPGNPQQGHATAPGAGLADGSRVWGFSVSNLKGVDFREVLSESSRGKGPRCCFVSNFLGIAGVAPF